MTTEKETLKRLVDQEPTHWRANATHLVNVGPRDVQIPICRADTLEKIFGWAVYISTKAWATPESLADFLRCAAKASNLKLYEP